MNDRLSTVSHNDSAKCEPTCQCYARNAIRYMKMEEIRETGDQYQKPIQPGGLLLQL